MDTVIVGDLHGKHEIVEEVLKWGCNVVFVGDYLDSFDRSVKDQVYTLLLVLDAIEAEPERVQGLLGNHELSYIEDGMVCSGYKGATQAHIIHMKSRMRKLLKEYVWIQDILVTHAGLTKQSVPDKYLDGVSGIAEFLESRDYENMKFNIGRSRGGWGNMPGIFWCDWWEDFKPIEGVRQVCGHSSYRPNLYEGVTGIVTEGNNWNIDCLDRVNEVLMIRDDGSVVIHTLDI